MDATRRYIETFRQEAEEHLADIEDAVLDIEQNPDDKECINRLFRAVHTIKGSGAMFGFNDIAGFTHHLESVLDRVREGLVPVTGELINLILLARDQIKMMLDAGVCGVQADNSICDSIAAELKKLMPEEETPVDIPGTSGHIANEVKSPADTGKKGSKTYKIRFEPNPDIISTGMEPAMILKELSDLGETRIEACTESIPLLEKLPSEKCFFSWDILLTTFHDNEDIKDVFIFVEEDSRISIRAVDEEPCPEPEKPSIEELESIDAVPESIDTVPKDMSLEAGDDEKKQTMSAEKQVLKPESIRVRSDKLDKLINLVGELVITQARLTQVFSDLDNEQAGAPVEEIERLTAELRDCALNMRMLPIRTIFGKFRRLVRDLSATLGKEIELVTEGGETELDKTVIERLNDPLVHLIRNSIDHGIQTPEVREQNGKPGQGTIRLAAAHRGAKVVITIDDDGMGINPDFIRSKAVEKGLISDSEEMGEAEIYALLFTPGFSTAKKVTNVSGRGVGMDVVKRDINALGGSIRISSGKNEGTSINLSMPLTLAIIDGLLVRVGEMRYVLPLEYVEECAELSDAHFEKARGRNVIQVREELIPFVRLRNMFKISGYLPDTEQIAVVQVEHLRAGIIVDEIIGNIQTVIKSLDRVYRNAEGISGATIMGDGSVSLIVDLQGVINRARRDEEKNLVFGAAS